MQKITHIRDILNYMLKYLQRTDKMAFKLTNSYHNALVKFRSPIMEISEELSMYIADIDTMDYAWKNDAQHMQRSIINDTNNLGLNNKYIITHDLWWFDFNATFTLCPDKYIFIFNTTVFPYTVAINFGDKNQDVLISDAKSYLQPIKFEINKKTTIKINCRETLTLKQNKIIKYMLVIPESYYNKIDFNNAVF